MPPAGGRSVPNERTALAWTRTALALAAAALVAVRITIDRLGALAVALAVLAVVLAIVVLVAAARRYRTAQTGLAAGDPLPDGRLPAVVSALVVVLAVTELAFVLSD